MLRFRTGGPLSSVGDALPRIGRNRTPPIPDDGVTPAHDDVYELYSAICVLKLSMTLCPFIGEYRLCCSCTCRRTAPRVRFSKNRRPAARARRRTNAARRYLGPRACRQRVDRQVLDLIVGRAVERRDFIRNRRAFDALFEREVEIVRRVRIDRVIGERTRTSRIGPRTTRDSVEPCCIGSTNWLRRGRTCRTNRE